MKKMKYSCSVVFILICSVTVSAQTNNARSLAFNAYEKKNWTDAEKYFTQHLQNNPSDTFAVYYLGMSQLKQAKYKEALNNFRDVYELELSSDMKDELCFEMAKMYAYLNQNEKAFQFLETAARNGASYEERLNDSAFHLLRSSSKFANISENFKRNSTPCLYDDKYKKLDFFVGTWEVYVGDNYTYKVAVDTVTKFYGGCSVDEKFSWLGSDYVGESISFYDDAAQKFRMCWAGKSGDIRNFEEISSGKNEIQFLAITTSKRNLVHRKMTITYDPSNENVHEFIENSFDLGKTWEPDFDALFKKAGQ